MSLEQVPHLEDLQDRYRFYIMNPRTTEGVEYSLWIQEEEYEYQILSSNTGGFEVFSSRYKDVGDGIEPTEEFFLLLGRATHEAMCYTPGTYFNSHVFETDHFERTAQSIYDGKVREYEAYAACVLSHHFTAGEQWIPEFEPMIRWADQFTEFDIPLLVKHEGGEQA